MDVQARLSSLSVGPTSELIENAHLVIVYDGREALIDIALKYPTEVCTNEVLAQELQTLRDAPIEVAEPPLEILRDDLQANAT